jgi:hypothetical protein
MIREWKAENVAVGLQEDGPCGKRKVVILLDGETFQQVRAYAIKEKFSFAQAARELIEFGLEDLAA